MPRLGGADEIVVGEVERLAIARNARELRSASALRRDALLDGRLLHLQAVLVGAGEEEHVLAVESLEARDRVGGDRLVGMTDMRGPLG